MRRLPAILGLSAIHWYDDFSSVQNDLYYVDDDLTGEHPRSPLSDLEKARADKTAFENELIAAN